MIQLAPYLLLAIAAPIALLSIADSLLKARAAWRAIMETRP